MCNATSLVKCLAQSEIETAMEAVYEDPKEMRTIADAAQMPARMRNLAIIAHVDHGKTTIADRLLAKASMLREQGVAKACKMDTGTMEAERGITIKATSTGLLYRDENLLINLIDCPGHVDFNGEVTAALRITDGALVVVDCVEGVCVQTETVLRQALEEGVRPILFLNKVDRAIGELQLSPEDAYTRFASTIDAVNVIIREYREDFTVHPEDNTVIFGSGLFGWAFTLASFAAATPRLQHLACNTKFLWGDRWANKSTGKIVKSPPSAGAERTFVANVLQPLYRLHHIADTGDIEKLAQFVKRNALPMPAQEPRCKDMVRSLLRKWLNCADTIVSTAAARLPSPFESQRERAEQLYTGDASDAACVSMRRCDANGPLIVYITKLVPLGEGKKLIALGRVFSGTVRPGQKVNVIEHSHDKQISGKISSVKMVMVDKMESLDSAPAGALVGLVGIDKLGTVVSDPATCSMRAPCLAVSPVVSVAVSAKNKSDTARVVDALRRLAKTDASLTLEHDEETDEHCLVGAGELHIESALHDLGETLPAGVQFNASEPAVRCREMATEEGRVCLAKSSNKHNRIFARAVPLDMATEDLLERGVVTQQTDEKTRSEEFAAVGWDRNEARKKVARISGSNVLVDCTTGLNINEVLEHLAAAFDSVIAAGVLAGSPVVGVRMEIHEGTKWHKDRKHRGPAEMVPAATRAFKATLLTASPRLREPIFEVKVQVPEAMADKTCSVLKQLRGDIRQLEYDRLITVEAHVPVEESFGLSGELRKVTAGYAFPQCAFSHWREIPGNPLEAGNLASAVVEKTRTRKRLPPQVPTVESLEDKL